MPIGDKISYLRRQKGMTQAQLAEQLGISAQAVSKWESGLSCPDIMTLLPLSKILGVSTDVLLGAEGPGEENGTMGLVLSKENGVPEEETAEPIHTLDMALGAVEVKIAEGTGFSLTSEGIEDDQINAVNENGVWMIRDQSKNKIISGVRNQFKGHQVMLTVPAGYHFQSVKLKLGAGKMTSCALDTEEGLIDVGAGAAKIASFSSSETKINCGMGEVRIEAGRIKGKCQVSCGMGNVRVVTEKPGEYGYRISVGMGAVKVGQDGFSGIVSGKHTVNGDAENFFDVNCGMGNVELLF